MPHRGLKANAECDPIDAHRASAWAFKGRRSLAMVAIIVLLATLAIALHLFWVDLRGREIGPELPDSAYAGVPTKIRISGERTGSVAIEIGTLEAGGRISRPIELYNSGLQPVLIGNLTKSCDCFDIEFAQKRIESGESARATVVLELKNEPQFRGGLSILAKLWDHTGNKLLTELLIEADVR